MDRNKLIEEIFASMQAMHRAGATKFHSLLGRFNITSSQLELLLLVKHAGSITFKELANRMRLTPGAVTQLVNSLVELGYLSRQEDTKDRRVSHVMLTASGKDNLGQIWHERKGMMLRIMEDLNEQELRLMLRIQQQITAHMEEKTNTVRTKKEEQ